jgi:hypothetical protein
MSTVIEIEKLALDLSERERAMLAMNLLKSLPPILTDEDGGVAKALKRDAEIEEGSCPPISLTELNSLIRNRG